MLLTEDSFSDIICKNPDQLSMFIKEKVISLLKDIHALDFMNRFLLQITSSPSIEQFIEQIYPLLSSMPTQILNCFNKSTTLL
jgi:hypothetical protein